MNFDYAIFDSYEYYMDLCNESCFSGPAGLRGKNVHIGHYMQIVHPAFFIPALRIANIDFYHCVPLSLTLALPGGHKGCEEKTYWLHFLPHFSVATREITFV